MSADTFRSLSDEPTASVIARDRLHDNPWQLWPLDPAHVAELAGEYRAKAPLPPIVVRPHPEKLNHYQIAAGHHRVAALGQLGDRLVTATVRNLTDLEMAQIAISENFKRRVPSSIDKARAAQRLTAPPFSLTQADVAKRLGYANPATVAHLLQLLKLPAAVQAHADSGALPERLARQLLPLARSLPAQAQVIADAVAQSDEKEATFDEAVHAALNKYGRHMWDAPWRANGGKGDFTGPITYVAATAKALGLETLPPCTGCEFHLRHEGNAQCARPGCFDAKVTAWRWVEVEKSAKRLGVAVAAPGETVKVIFDGADSDQKRVALAALKLNHPSLRLAVTTRKLNHWEPDARAREALLGSNLAALATTDWPALKKLLPATLRAVRGDALPVEKPKSLAARQAENDRKWKAGEKARAAVRLESKRLLTVAAGAAAPLLPDHAGLIQLLAPRDAAWSPDWKAAKTLKAKKVLVMYDLLDDRAGDMLGQDQQMNYSTPDGMRSAMVATLTALKVSVPAALSASGRPSAATAVAPTAKPKGKGKPKPAAKRKPAAKAAKAKPKKKGKR